MMKEGTKAPEFSLPDSRGEQVSLGDYAGKWLVLYFYPKDNTRDAPGRLWISASSKRSSKKRELTSWE
mgnify:CR=1 FL=1